jgi:hypothetical protein
VIELPLSLHLGSLPELPGALAHLPPATSAGASDSAILLVREGHSHAAQELGIRLPHHIVDAQLPYGRFIMHGLNKIQVTLASSAPAVKYKLVLGGQADAPYLNWGAALTTAERHLRNSHYTTPSIDMWDRG